MIRPRTSLLRRTGRSAIYAAVLSSLLLGIPAAAQQPPPAQPAPGQPAPAQPAPGQPGQPTRPMLQPLPGPPSQLGQPTQPGQPGQPRPLRPMPGQGQPGLPPGHPPFPGMGHGGQAPRPGGKAPAREVAPVKKKTLEECPGHGPLDPPHHVNWWRGLLMVNNERAKQGGTLNHLLFRYHNENDPCDPDNEPPPFLASILNFGLLAFVIYRFGRKPVAEALQKRKATIMTDIENATRLRDEAEKRLEHYKDRFEHIEETLAELKAEYAAQAEIEKKHILAEAEERRARMRRDAEFRVEQELKSARAELLAEAVRGAVGAAEELIRQRATTQDQDRIAQEYLRLVPAAVASGTRAVALTGGAPAEEGSQA